MIKWRNTHRYVALLATLPLVVISVTGLILQLRNQFEFIQPAIVKNKETQGMPLMTVEKVLEGFKEQKVEQVIFRPLKNSLAVRLEGGMEVQLHPQTGEVIKKAMRRTGFLIDLHQGSWMGKIGQYGVYFLGSLGLIYLIISGIVIYPFKRKRNI